MRSAASIVAAPASLAIRRGVAMLSIVRLHRPTETPIRSLSATFDCEWPISPNSTAARGTILWMAPEAWLVDGIDPAVVRTRVSRACAGALYHVSDMSAAYAKFEISGENSRALLAKSCPLDFHSRVFLEGHCGQSLFAQVSALIARPGPECRFTLYVESSVAQYLEEWLTDAAAEYAMWVPPEKPAASAV